MPTGLSSCPVHLYFRAMDWPDYLRDQAAMYRRLAEQADDPVVKNEMLELASVCEEVANNIEDHLTGGEKHLFCYRRGPGGARPRGGLVNQRRMLRPIACHHA